MMTIENTQGSTRELMSASAGLLTSDGNGVSMTRFIGTPHLDSFDPFLLLDVSGSDKPNDYVSPLFMDVQLPGAESFQQAVDAADNAFDFVIAGNIEIGNQRNVLSEKNLGLLEPGKNFLVRAIGEPARFLLVSAAPLHKPVARGGPFVMNSQDEVRQAFDDFRNKRF